MAEDSALADSFYRANLLTNLAGELFVRGIEVRKATTIKLADDFAFLDLPFEEAIAHFLSRRVLSADEFAALSDAERFRSFAMTRAASARLADRARELLAAAMQPNGVGLDEFIRQIRADEALLGFTPNNPTYLENVYRTATATSYNAGRYRAQTDPDVVEATGFWEYVTAGDNRVRDTHAALNGKQWTIGDPEAESVYPPNSYQCRCVVVVREADDVREGDMDRRVDAAAAVDDGFSGSPGAAIEDEAARG